MIVFSAKRTAVHEMHIAAFSEYALRHGMQLSHEVYSWRALCCLFRSKDRVLFSQSTGILSLPILAIARMKGLKVVHYMHEPTPLKRKLSENPRIKSLVWHAVQWCEMHLASRVLVSRDFLLVEAAHIYNVSREKISIAPLLLSEVHVERRQPRKRLTYLGRIDTRRYFEEFLEASETLATRGYLPTILTGDVTNLQGFSDKIPTCIDVISEKNFSEELKNRILSETICLWNPKRGEIAQSGVTADAVRYGVSILLTDKDPAYETLVFSGVALDFISSIGASFANIDDISPQSVIDSAAQIFSAAHGEDAFVKYYAPEVGHD